jgi:hypothetical protein
MPNHEPFPCSVLVGNENVHGTFLGFCREEGEVAAVVRIYGRPLLEIVHISRVTLKE